ncbi:MAG: hypothetical protein WC341_12080 [Bacteroidales bacterium]|jgi:hypothetical protein
MKNIFPILLALFVIAIFSQCKKSNPSTNPEITCINTSFVDTLGINFNPQFIEEDNQGNIIILGSAEDVIKLVRLNADGELQWQKDYPQIQGKPQGLVFIDENSFFIKSSTSHYEYELSEHYYADLWKQVGYMLDSSNTYIPFYEFWSGNPYLHVESSNQTYLTRIDAEGDIIFTKQFIGDACDGESFFRVNSNDFLFLTSEIGNTNFEIISWDGFVDTIAHVSDKNKRTVYRIDSDGNIIWSTPIEHIFNPAWAESSIYQYRQGITQNGNRIIVNTSYNTFELTLTGEVVNEYQPLYNNHANWTYSMVNADASSNYFFSIVSTFDASVAQTVLFKYDVINNETLWQKNNYPVQNMCSGPNGNLIMHVLNQELNSLIKLNEKGEELWSGDMPDELWGGTFSSACNGGALLAFPLESAPDKIVVVKTTENGEF